MHRSWFDHHLPAQRKPSETTLKTTTRHSSPYAAATAATARLRSQAAASKCAISSTNLAATSPSKYGCLLANPQTVPLAPTSCACTLVNTPTAPHRRHSLTVDPALDSLLPLAQRPTYRGKDGSNGNPAQGTGGSKKRGKVVPRTPPLRVGVPPGTVVRRKRGGAVLGELINVGDTLCVVRGGRGARAEALDVLCVAGHPGRRWCGCGGTKEGKRPPPRGGGGGGGGRPLAGRRQGAARGRTRAAFAGARQVMLFLLWLHERQNAVCDWCTERTDL